MSETTDSRTPNLIVGVGASAGGLEAFKALLAELPSDSGMTFLLVQHLDPNHKSLLVELLAPCTDMRVTDAAQGRVLEPDTVYIIRPDTALGVDDGKIELSTPTLHRGVRLPVDHLFRSLARNYGWRSVGIVLSGAGSDGSVGLRDIKSAGGLTIAQTPESTQHSGMPRSAIDTGIVDLVIDIDEIPAALERFAQLPAPARCEPNNPDLEPGESEGFDRQTLDKITAALEAHLGFDLRVYKIGTVERRLLRRMALAGFEQLEDYLAFARENHSELQTIVRDLMISVTEFFRDPESFRALREMVVDPIVANASPGVEIRIWVPACASGEEAYSIAIEFLDALAAHNKRNSLQLFATDVDQDALAIGRAGIYPTSIVERVSDERLRTYFKLLDECGYQIRPALRDVVSFARHDLTKDPPFSRMDLVSCRNVLIYLTNAAQRHVLEVLHFAMQPGAFLFLSTSESTGPQRDLFSTVSKPHRIYAKVGTSHPISSVRARVRTDAREPAVAPGRPKRARGNTGEAIAHRALLRHWVPPTVIVSEQGKLQFAHGELGPFLHFPQGDDPRLEIGPLLRPHVVTRARSALYRCRRSGEPVTGHTSPDAADDHRTRITAIPVPEFGDGAVMLTFEQLGATAGEATSPEAASGPEQDTVIDQLEKELLATREDLRNTTEELETSTEELRSSNEESMSMNEELQSANEELEATTEELRSLNEELTTVNSQLRDKIEQLEHAHDDLHNFLVSTKIATLFLDDQLRIKRFTPAARALLDIDHADIGRSVGDIARELLQDDLSRASRRVLEELSLDRRELWTSNGRWISREILPYRTEGRRIEGVVVTFTDVTRLKLATERFETRERQQAVVASLGLLALRESDLQAFFDTVARDVQRTLGTDYCKILERQPDEHHLLLRAGAGWPAGLVGDTLVPTGPESQAGYTLLANEPVLVEDLTGEQRFTGPPLLHEFGVKSGVSCVIGDGAQYYGVIGAHCKVVRTFTTEDANFLQAVAGVVASAVTRAQARICAALELGVAQVFSDARAVEELFAGLVRCFAAELGIVVGELWWVDEGGRSMTRRALEILSASERADIEAQLPRRTLSAGEGVVGTVLSEAHATWAVRTVLEPDLDRTRAATALRLVSGLAFPILLDGEVLGVVGLSTRDHLYADRALLRSLEGIGRTIGSFIAKTRLQHRERRLAAITEASHDAILSYDVDGRILDWLSGAEQLYGFPSADMVGQHLSRIVVPDQRESQELVNRRIRAGEVVEPWETERVRADSSSVVVSVRNAAIRDHDGAILEISSTERDISRQKQTEHKLVEADRQKDEFIAMLGHELRNPLGAIRSAALLLEPHCREDPELRTPQVVLERQIRHMTKLLDGLLDISRIVRGKIKLERHVVDFAQICRDVLADATMQFEDRELELDRELPDAPVWVFADRVRAAQIVTNLISNAIRYTPDGGRVTVELREVGGRARLEVSDTGAGIDAKLLPYIFEVFRQAEQPIDRNRGGLGLGLALVRSLTSLHGGTIDVHSDGPNAGATFVVHLPLADGETQPQEPAGEASATVTKKVLIIEDNEDAAELLRLLLVLAGLDVKVATHGAAGVELARTWTPDAVICDIGLPGGMSGYAVAEALRGDPRTEGLRLIAVSGYGRPENKARAREAGFDVYLIKPLDPKALERALGSG